MLVNSHTCRTREVTGRVRVSTGINGAVQVISTIKLGNDGNMLKGEEGRGSNNEGFSRKFPLNYSREGDVFI